MKSPEIHIHVVAFDIPYPPIYGGVIDVFNQIRELYEAGVKVHLHAFTYGKGIPSAVLEALCFEVHYYKRKMSWPLLLHAKPYIALTRASRRLIDNLSKDQFPILFEGLHTCFYLNDQRLAGRLKLVRPTNIEHHYYARLGLAERNPIHKAYFLIEAIKLFYFQKFLRYADILLAVSQEDTIYFSNRFPQSRVVTLPCFHGNRNVATKRDKGEYLLYHGDLQTAENERAAVFLIREVMTGISYPLIIAGNAPSQKLIHLASQNPNIKIVDSPDEASMQRLIADARVILLYTFQATGLKLKLLISLFSGTPVIANEKMLHGTGLEDLCHVANDASEIKSQMRKVLEEDNLFSKAGRDQSILDEIYNDQKNASRLIELITPAQSHTSGNRRIITSINNKADL